MVRNFACAPPPLSPRCASSPFSLICLYLRSPLSSSTRANFFAVLIYFKSLTDTDRLSYPFFHPVYPFPHLNGYRYFRSALDYFLRAYKCFRFLLFFRCRRFLLYQAYATLASIFCTCTFTHSLRILFINTAFVANVIIITIAE